MSHRKVNGNGTISLVQDAIKKCRCNPETFFARAVHVAKNAKVMQNGGSPLKDAHNFSLVAHKGIVAVPGYKVPDYAVRLAENVASHSGDPYVYFKTLK